MLARVGPITWLSRHLGHATLEITASTYGTGSAPNNGSRRSRWRVSSASERYTLARILGTSMAQLEDTYARWLQRTGKRIRAAFDAYDRRGVPWAPGLVTICAETMSAPLVDNQGRSTCSASF